MRNKTEFWKAHIAAIKREGVSTSAYAKRHALAVGSLHRWRRKLNGETSATAVAKPHSEAFVALRVAAPEPATKQVVSGCTLTLGLDLRLEMTTLPAPEWLVALSRAAQGER